MRGGRSAASPPARTDRALRLPPPRLRGGLIGQAAVGFDAVRNAATVSMVLFDVGFRLAGVALPLLFVYRVGRFSPRWMLLVPVPA
jgi:hypothetical protein